MHANGARVPHLHAYINGAAAERALLHFSAKALQLAGRMGCDSILGFVQHRRSRRNALEQRRNTRHEERVRIEKQDLLIGESARLLPQRGDLHAVGIVSRTPPVAHSGGWDFADLGYIAQWGEGDAAVGADV